MSYRVHARANFLFKEGQEEAALAAIKGLKGKETSRDSHGPYFRCVDDNFLKAETLEAALAKWRWEWRAPHGYRLEEGEEGSWYFTGESAGDDNLLFTTLAPFIEAGGSIEWRGEDGKKWRYLFDGAAMKIQKGKTVWED